MSQAPNRPKVGSPVGPDGTQRPPVLFVFDRLVTPLLNGIAAAVLFSLMLLTCADVTARYFGRPIFGGFELTEIMLAALIFAGLPLVTLRNDHVTVDLFDAVTPDWLLRIQHVAACALGFVCIAFVSWRLWLRAIHIGAASETTGQLKIPMSWLAYSMSVLTALTAVTLIILMLRPPKRDDPLTSL